MIPLLRHILQPAYLYAQNPAAGGVWRAVHTRWIVVLALAALLTAAWAGQRARRGRSPWAIGLAGSCFALALVAQVIRFRVGGPLSTRVIWLSAASTGLIILAVERLAAGGAGWLRRSGRALALCPRAGDLPSRREALALTLLHVLGMGFGLCCGEAPLWLPLAALAMWGLATWQLGGDAGRSRLRPELLAPWLVGYGGALLRWLVQDGLGVDTASYGAFRYPDLWSPWFDPRITWGLSLAWALLLTLALLRHERGRSRWQRASALGASLALLAAGWYLWTAGVHLSHGATGSDPHCYLCMALDLAETGSPLHRFPLTTLGHAAEVPLWPLVPVGYHPPDAALRAATVWPSGWPALLAPLAWLGGESLALWGAPLMALLAAALTVCLGHALWPREGCVAGGIAALLLLTAPEGIARSLVPMADAAAQACTALYLLALVLTLRRDALRWSVLAGCALALAFWVRHPLILMASAAMALLFQREWSWPRRWRHLLAFAVGMLPFLALDLAYRWRVFGAPWATESQEWSLLGIRYLGATLGNMVRDGLLRRDAFGYLWPLAVIGLLGLLRTKAERRWGVMLLAGLLPALLFQLSYRALRWRDLISLFPYVALWIGYGVVRLWRWAGEHSRRRFAILAVVLFLLSARTIPTLRLPLRTDIATFGHISREQRAAYAQLARDLPTGAVIGAGLDAGALALYTGHETIRPAVWSAAELDRFCDALRAAGLPLVLLDDDAQMTALIRSLSDRLDPGPSYDLPRFGPGGEPLPGRVRSYRLRD